MKNQLNKSIIERFSRQIVLKKIGAIGQKNILNSKVSIVGIGGLGCPAAEFLARVGVGELNIIDNDKVSLTNIHRQSLFNTSDVGKTKVSIAKKKIKLINPNTKMKIYNTRLNKDNIKDILANYNYIIDGSDNFKTKFLLNDYCVKQKKTLITGAISKFDGHIFSFDFKKNDIPCLRCFYQEDNISDEQFNCEYEGILGTVAGIVGIIQANEIVKKILNIGQRENKNIFIFDFLNLNLRNVKLKKRKDCFC